MTLPGAPPRIELPINAPFFRGPSVGMVPPGVNMFNFGPAQPAVNHPVGLGIGNINHLVGPAVDNVNHLEGVVFDEETIRSIPKPHPHPPTQMLEKIIKRLNSIETRLNEMEQIVNIHH